MYVKFGEDGEVAEIIDEVRDQWQGIGVLDCMFIQVAVVLDWLEFPILLFDKEKGGGLRGF